MVQKITAIATATVIVIVTQRPALNPLSTSFGMPVSYTRSKEGRRSYSAGFARALKRTRT